MNVKVRTHGTPPWASSPPGETEPDTRLLHRANGTLHSGDASGVGASTHLTKESLEIVLLEPIRGNLKTFSANGGGDTCTRGAGAVGVQILVHL